jgi:hypothetical protein
MKILSVDVGIKNLAFCLFVRDETSHYLISKWDVINLSQEIDLKCGEYDKNKACDKPAKFSKDGKCYCLRHSKKLNFQIPTAELKPGYINKQKIQTLYELAEKYNIKYEKPIKKIDLTTLINNYIHESCLEPIEKSSASRTDLVTIGRNIQIKLDEILGEHLTTIDKVIIENQISPIANRMKTIQGMIAQYFIMRNSNTSIDFISASNKLKEFSKEKKSNYSERKKLGIQHCLNLINGDFKYQEWVDFFIGHKKKDDLADSFLQGIWYINNKS